MTAAIWILGALAVLSALTLTAATMLTHSPDLYREDVDDRESLYDGENFI